MWGACFLRQRQANSCACQEDSGRNKIRSVRFLDLATSYPYWPPLLSVPFLLCLFLTWHQVEVSSAPPLTLSPSSASVSLLCSPVSRCPPSLLLPILTSCHSDVVRTGENTVYLFVLVLPLRRVEHNLSTMCAWRMDEREVSGAERGVCFFVSPFSVTSDALTFSTTGWDEWVWPHVCVNHGKVWE